MNKEALIRKHEGKIPLATIDGATVFGRDVDEKNRTIYIIEKDGKKDVVLYNQIDQLKLPKRDFTEMDIKIHKRTDTGEEVLTLRNYDDNGKQVHLDIKKLREDFIKKDRPPKEKKPKEVTPPVPETL